MSCVLCCFKKDKCVDTVALSSGLQPSKALPVPWTVCSKWPNVNQEAEQSSRKGVKEEEKLNYYIFNPCLLLSPSYPPFCFHLGTESHSSCQILLMCVKHEWSHTVQSCSALNIAVLSESNSFPLTNSSVLYFLFPLNACWTLGDSVMSLLLHPVSLCLHFWQEKPVLLQSYIILWSHHSRMHKKELTGDMNSNVGIVFNSLWIHLAFTSKDLVRPFSLKNKSCSTFEKKKEKKKELKRIFEQALQSLRTWKCNVMYDFI